MTPKIQEFIEKKQELEKQIAEHGRAALLEGFAALFAASPSIEAVRWRQYTPYFNDGEPCEFSVREPYYKLVGGSDEAGDYGDGFEYAGYMDSPVRAAVELTKHVKLFTSELEDVFHATFGDHAKVTVSRDLSVEVEQYDHN